MPFFQGRLSPFHTKNKKGPAAGTRPMVDGSCIPADGASPGTKRPLPALGKPLGGGARVRTFGCYYTMAGCPIARKATVYLQFQGLL